MRAGLFGGDWEDYSDALQDAVGKAFWDAQPPPPDGVSASAQISTAMNDPGAGINLPAASSLDNAPWEHEIAFHPAGGVNASDSNANQPMGETVTVTGVRPSNSDETKAPADADFSDDSTQGLQKVARATYTVADVLNAVNQANQLAADIYARYAPGKSAPSAAQQTSDRAKIKAMQDQLTRMKYSDLPPPNQPGPSLYDNIMGASNYLYQATMNAHLGSVSNIPPAAGAGLFGFDDDTLPPDTLAPPQRIGPID